MNKIRIICLSLIAVCILTPFIRPAGGMKGSYQKYLDGTYYFRARAYTVMGQGAYSAPSSDASGQMNGLLLSQGHLVYVSNPHSGTCDLVDGNYHCGNFPMSHLNINKDDLDLFNDTHSLTYDEYTDKVREISRMDDGKYMLSHPKEMKRGLIPDAALWAPAIINAGLLFVLFFFGLDKEWANVFLILLTLMNFTYQIWMFWMFYAS